MYAVASEAHEKWGGPVASLMISGGVSRPIGHRTNIVSVKKWGGQSPPKPPCSEPMNVCNLPVIRSFSSILFL